MIQSKSWNWDIVDKNDVIFSLFINRRGKTNIKK